MSVIEPALVGAMPNSFPHNETEIITAKAKADWTKSQLEALCPVSQWDVVFASQVDSVITNPVVPPVPDTAYSIPS